MGNNERATSNEPHTITSLQAFKVASQQLTLQKRPFAKIRKRRQEVHIQNNHQAAIVQEIYFQTS